MMRTFWIFLLVFFVFIIDANAQQSANNVKFDYRNQGYWHNYCKPCDTAIVATNNNDKDVYVVVEIHDCKTNIFSKRQAKLIKNFNGTIWTFSYCTAIHSIIRVDFCEDFTSYAEYLMVLDRLGIKFD
jgi:hypothetical protein